MTAIPPPFNWVSIDPGSKNVGMAWWRRNKCLCIETYAPLRAMQELMLRQPTLLVVEQFRLYPSHAQTLTGSVMGTSQVIGALALWAYIHDSAMYLQPAAIKTPTRALMKTNRAQSLTGSGHAQDAQLHGYYWLHRGRHRDQPGTIFTGIEQE